jgi:hypothetical protein
MLKAIFKKLPHAFLFALFGISTVVLPGQAQKNDADLSSILLEGGDCVVSGSGSRSRLYDEVSVVSINRQVFDRIFSIGAYKDGNFVTLSCRADPAEYGLVDLQMGVTDNAVRNEANLTVNIYQGGNLIHTFSNMRAGSIATVVLDLNNPDVLSNPDAFAVEMTCYARSSDCYLQFIEARLYPAGEYTSFSERDPSSDSSSKFPTDDGIQRPTSDREDAIPNEETGSSTLGELDDILNDINNIRDDFCDLFGC